MDITIKSLDNIKLCASTSSYSGTGTNNDAGGTTITISYDSTKAWVHYLQTPSTKKSFENSIAIAFRWGENSEKAVNQEVILMVEKQAGKRIKSIIWKVNNTVFNEDSAWIQVGSNSTITAKVNYENTTGTNNHGTITNLQLYGYYVSKVGYTYLGGGSVLTPNKKVGSWNVPGKAYHRETSNYPGHSWSGVYYYKDFNFTPPEELPNYYIMIAYKGYKQGIGHIQIVESGTNNFHQDQNSYYNGGYADWGVVNYRCRYSFYSIYSDEVVPSIGTDYNYAEIERNNQTVTERNQVVVSRQIAQPYAMWIQFDNPNLTLYNIKWYRWKGSATATEEKYQGKEKYLLLDSNKQQLALKRVKDSKLTVPNVFGYSHYYTYSDDTVIEIFNATSERHTGKWYQKTSSWNTSSPKTNSQVEDISVTSDLSFAAIIEPKTYNITYKDKDIKATKTFTVNHGTTLTINPYGNLGGGTATHKYPHQDGSYTGTGSYNVTVTKHLEVEDPTSSLGWRFIGWIRNGNTLTAYWEPNTIQLTYNANNGARPVPTVSEDVNYNTSYTIKAHDNPSLGFTPPTGKPYFVSWNTAENGSGISYTPGQKKKFTSNTTLYAQWGSPWKKVKAIWIYSDTQITGRIGIKQGNGYWYPYKPWVHKT